jgi:hypothetical protein
LVVLESLRGADLADYAPLDQWSHADILLEICDADRATRAA